MTLEKLKNLIMIQTGNDVEDYPDFAEQSLVYLNAGYRRVYRHWHGKMPETGLALDTDEPQVPEALHEAIADWATWLLYRNGNISKQNRGLAFREAAERALSQVPQNGGMAEKERMAAARFTNLYSR